MNAFVKRDTPKEDEKGIGETIEEWANKAVEDLKTDLNKAIDDVSKSVSIWHALALAVM